jgi:hypothetical protein
VIRRVTSAALTLARIFDRHQVAIVSSVGFLVASAVAVCGYLQSDPVLLAGAAVDQRLRLFDQAGSIALGLLGITFTVLAILTALPSNERTEELRNARAWGLLEYTLLVTAAFALATTAFAYTASALDDGREGCESLEAVLIGVGAAMVAGAILGGVAFALVLRSLRTQGGYRAPRGRGSGPA